jgi:hypothetical protein
VLGQERVSDAEVGRSARVFILVGDNGGGLVLSSLSGGGMNTGCLVA